MAGVVLGGRLYTVETNKNLWATDLGTGEWKAVGKTRFADMRRMFAARDRLYTIDKAGGLFQVDPADGERRRLGESAEWKSVLAGAVLKDNLYTAEGDGGLYATDLETGQRRPIRMTDFADAAHLFAAGDRLYEIDRAGSLYAVEPNDGGRRRLGEVGAWKDTIAGVVLNGKLYTTETNGGLYETNLDNGAWTQLGQAEFGDTTFMFAADDHVYTIEKSGSLYRVQVK